MLDPGPLYCLSSGLEPDIYSAEKRQEKIGEAENQETLVKLRAQLDNDEYQAHRHEKGADDLKRKIEHSRPF